MKCATQRGVDISRRVAPSFSYHAIVLPCRNDEVAITVHVSASGNVGCCHEGSAAPSPTWYRRAKMLKRCQRAITVHVGSTPRAPSALESKGSTAPSFSYQLWCRPSSMLKRCRGRRRRPYLPHRHHCAIGIGVNVSCRPRKACFVYRTSIVLEGDVTQHCQSLTRCEPR